MVALAVMVTEYSAGARERPLWATRHPQFHMMTIMRARAAFVLLGPLLAGCGLLLGVDDLAYVGPDAGADLDAAPGEEAPIADAGTDDRTDANGDGGGCDADVMTSPTSCGACGHDCLGGACDGGVCEPVLVTTGTGLQSLASDGTTLFLRDVGAVHACPVSGCADAGTILATTTDITPARRVRVTSTRVLWNEGVHVYACAKTGCAPKVDILQNAANSRSVFDVWVSDAIFWIAQANGVGPYAYTVGSCPINGGACKTLTSGADQYLGIVAGSGFDVYWTVAGGTVRHCVGVCSPDASTSATTALTNPSSLALDDGGLWAGYSGGLAWLTTDLSKAVPISSSGYVTRVLQDGADVFYIEATKREVRRCPAKAGACSPKTLATTSANFTDIAADPKAVYWIEGTKQVWRLAR